MEVHFLLPIASRCFYKGGYEYWHLQFHSYTYLPIGNFYVATQNPKGLGTGDGFFVWIRHRCFLQFARRTCSSIGIFGIHQRAHLKIS